MTDTQPAYIVPDEAVEAGVRAFREGGDCGSWESSFRAALAAAAPFIVAANQPEPAHRSWPEQQHQAPNEPRSRA